jgi:uncharacterized OsmC-like protein
MAAEVDPVWKHVRVEASDDDTYTRALVREKHEVLIDESTELPFGGDDAHPSAVDLLLTSLTACQVSVLQQCLEKARIEDYHLEAEATVDNAHHETIPDEMPENTARRVEHIVVHLAVTVPDAYESRASRCVEVYDQGCIVGQSFKGGISYTPEVTVTVGEPAADS